jgi:hypothetical protein
MDDTTLYDETCLSPDEHREVEAAWRALQVRLQPVGEMIEHAAKVDCKDLYAAFLHLAVAFDTFEQAVMRAQQIRLLHAAHRRAATG